MDLESQSPWVRDALLGVVLAVVAEGEVLLLDPVAVEGNSVGLHVANLLLIPAMALRRAAPFVSILVTALGFATLSALVAAPVATPYLALLFLLGSLGWYASTLTGAAGTGIILIAGLSWEVAADDSVIADLLVNSILIVLAWAGVHLLRRATDRRIAAEIKADRAARDAVAQERERISRDLHDSLAHALTLMTLQAGSAREREDPVLSRAALESIENSGREALADLHRFLGLLGPSDGEAQGLADIDSLVDGVRRGGVTVCVDIDAEGLPSSVDTTLFRVIQEGLTNAVRHSELSAIDVVVRREPRAAVCSVTSVGCPRDATLPTGGRGLRGLRQRLELFDGELHSCATAAGWQLRARVPLGAD